MIVEGAGLGAGDVACEEAPRAVEVDVRAPGGFALEDHWAEGSALEALRAGGWDAVVLQQGPSSLPESGANLTEWAARWADACC